MSTEGNPQPTITEEGKPAKKSAQPSPLNVRPKAHQLDFVNALIAEKGSQQKALEFIIDQAMNKGPAPAPAPTPTPPAPKPTPVIHGYTPAGEIVTALQKVMSRNKLTQNDAIDFSIKYTNKNQW